MKEKTETEAAALHSDLTACLMEMGELLLDCGAEISRTEDTLQRLGRAYGAEHADVFAIPSLIMITLSFPGGEAVTETRRIRSRGSNDFYRLEKLNALSRDCCREPLAIPELRARLDKIACGKKPRAAVYCGSVLAAGGFAVFFGGTLWDGLAAALFALLICLLQEKLGQTALNAVAFNLVISLLTGLGVGALCTVLPFLHEDMILIGDIMLLIPGIAITNAVRNMLVGDTISGAVRLIESLIWALALAGGFMVAMLAMDLLK